MKAAVAWGCHLGVGVVLGFVLSRWLGPGRAAVLIACGWLLARVWVWAFRRGLVEN